MSLSGLNRLFFRRNLLRWYDANKRDLPWRRTSDPYRIWISEVMLQQTRVTAVLPFYEAFLARFPSVSSLAQAPEQELLNTWAGLGYYSRARNLQAAARRIVHLGEFPVSYEALLSLPGVGEYTAAAVASIAFGLRQAAIDGNVVRVLSRVMAEPGEVTSSAVRATLKNLAEKLLDPDKPGDFNQAMMELGATICLPSQPQCPRCPIAGQCTARRLGRQIEFPVKLRKAANTEIESRLLVIERGGSLLLWQRPVGSPRMAGFWELPQADQLPEAALECIAGTFRHTIVNTKYRFEVALASIRKRRPEFSWVRRKKLEQLPLSTTTKKALACLQTRNAS